MDELDAYIGRILGLPPTDLTASETAKLPPASPNRPAALRRSRGLASITAVAATVLLAMVMLVTLRIGGQASLDRTNMALLSLRAAAFIDAPVNAVQATPQTTPGQRGRLAPLDRLEAKAYMSSRDMTSAWAARSSTSGRSRPVQLARVAPNHARARASSKVPTVVPGEETEAVDPMPVAMIRAATDDRVDAIDAIRLLRQQ